MDDSNHRFEIDRIRRNREDRRAKQMFSRRLSQLRERNDEIVRRIGVLQGQEWAPIELLVDVISSESEEGGRIDRDEEISADGSTAVIECELVADFHFKRNVFCALIETCQIRRFRRLICSRRTLRRWRRVLACRRIRYQACSGEV